MLVLMLAAKLPAPAPRKASGRAAPFLIYRCEPLLGESGGIEGSADLPRENTGGQPPNLWLTERLPVVNWLKGLLAKPMRCGMMR
jgi:hypothetical protein